MACSDLLLSQSSQNSHSQIKPTNEGSQVSDSSQIHGMMLKYSDNEVTDEEMRELNLQAAAHHYMMKSVMLSPRLHLFHFRNPPFLQQQCHLVNATFQMVKIHD